MASIRAFTRASKPPFRSQYRNIQNLPRSLYPIRSYSDQTNEQPLNISLEVRPRKRVPKVQTLGNDIAVRPYIPRHDMNIKDANILVEDNILYVGRTHPKIAEKHRKIPIPNIWLRDNCRCSECVHSDTRQRMLDTFRIPKDISIVSSRKTLDGTEIHWSDGHKSHYNDEFLFLAASRRHAKSYIRQGYAHLHLWGSEIAESKRQKYVDAERVLDGTVGLHDLLQNLRIYGFSYVTIPDATFLAPKTLLSKTEAILKSIAFIRETHYGGFYDFTSDLASADTAYTNIALEAHTDTTYFSDPAGLQAFHLISHTGGSGGASLLVDGFKAARELFESDHAAYTTLATTNVYAHASGNAGISIQPYRGFPVLEHDPQTGNLLRVRWNTADRAGIELDVAQTEVWYDAARKFDEILKKKENEYWEQLTPGRVLIFDNWRVLHGRSAFTGKRRICGGYINRDDYMSKAKMVLFGEQTVLDSLGV